MTEHVSALCSQRTLAKSEIAWEDKTVLRWRRTDRRLDGPFPAGLRPSNRGPVRKTSGERRCTTPITLRTWIGAEATTPHPARLKQAHSAPTNSLCNSRSSPAAPTETGCASAVLPACHVHIRARGGASSGLSAPQGPTNAVGYGRSLGNGSVRTRMCSP